MKGLSSKEIEVVSFLELNDKNFFSREDIKKFFKNTNELRVYINRLKAKKRVIKINKSKYYLVPVRAYQNKWSENPFIVIDEIFNGKNYFIGGFAAAHYWGFVDQIPRKIEVFCTNKQGKTKLFDTEIVFKRIRPKNLVGFVEQKTKNHSFKIASKEKVMGWLKSSP
jgi:predicted transcriptional regulator of viral defense system